MVTIFGDLRQISAWKKLAFKPMNSFSIKEEIECISQYPCNLLWRNF
jgi:hypothetical protein